MELTILGSGGCMVIPKPCCGCRVCEEARTRGAPFARTGPSAFVHDIRLLIDAPAEIALQLNRERLLLPHALAERIQGIRAIPVDRGDQTTFVCVFTDCEKRMVYAPCDIRPFPEHRREVRDADLLV